MSRTADPDPGEAAFVLASSSPRRRDLLASAGLRFVVDPAEIPEEPLESEPPVTYVRRLARAKAREVVERRRGAGDRRPVLAADTIVVLEGEVIDKPADREQARQQLQRLSGQTHEVITCFCLVGPDGAEAVELATTRVVFKRITEQELETYLDTGEWADKAGGYGVQGRAAHLVRSVAGSYTNVVGLPLTEAVEALERIGVTAGAGAGAGASGAADDRDDPDALAKGQGG